MNFELPALYKSLQAEADSVATRVEPMAIEADAMSAPHPGVRQALADSRLWELLVPSEYGGRFPQVDPLAVAVVREVLMATSSHLDSLFALQGIGSYAVSIGGSEEQRQNWLPRVASGETLAALGLTESMAGSDLKSLKTVVLDDADGGGLILNGEKAFISNGGVAGFYTVLAKDGDGFSMLLVPAEVAGLTTKLTPEIIAPHILADLQFEGVRLPRTSILGLRGQGFDLVLATLSVFRVSVAGASLGLANAALKEATRHAASRQQFGQPLARLGPVAEMLGDSWAELEAARLLTYRAAELARHDPAGSLHHSSMAKLVASETAGRIVDRAVQIMGRWGLIKDSKIERLYRQARPMRIYEGTSSVLRLSIARALVEQEKLP
jgi:acyl-CoA dehydrogenase